jgi:hypothetical protein
LSEAIREGEIALGASAKQDPKKNLKVEVGKTLAKPLRNVGCLRKTVRTSFLELVGALGGRGFQLLICFRSVYLLAFFFLLGGIHLLSLVLRGFFW